MATATVAQKSFFAHLYDEAGTLAKINGELVFFHDSGAITSVEPADCNFLVVLGECGLAQTQAMMDNVHGGYAAIACSRQNLEVAS
jgi:hypothetical protein